MRVLDRKLNRRTLTGSSVAASVALLASTILPISMIRAQDRGRTASPSAKTATLAVHRNAQGVGSPDNSGRESIASDRASSIVGRVVDAGGRPVPDVFVFVCQQDSGVPLSERFQTISEEKLAGRNDAKLARSITDEDGHFTFDTIPNGQYRLVAQQWTDMPPDADLTKFHAKRLRLCGIADRVQVGGEPRSEVEIRPLGTGTVRMKDNINKPGVVVALSLAPPPGDPVLGFAGWGGEFAQRAVGACIKAPGPLAVSGLPAGKLHVVVCGMTADDESGFGEGTVEITAGATSHLYVPVMSSWADDSPGPPDDLQELIAAIEAFGPRRFFARLLEDNDIDWPKEARPTIPHGIWHYWREISRNLDKQVKLPDGEEVEFGDVMAAMNYISIAARRPERL